MTGSDMVKEGGCINIDGSLCHCYLFFSL